METKLVIGKKATYFGGKKLLMKFLNLFITDFGTKTRSTLMKFIQDTRQEDKDTI